MLIVQETAYCKGMLNGMEACTGERRVETCDQDLFGRLPFNCCSLCLSRFVFGRSSRPIRDLGRHHEWKLSGGPVGGIVRRVLLPSRRTIG